MSSFLWARALTPLLGIGVPDVSDLLQNVEAIDATSPILASPIQTDLPLPTLATTIVCQLTSEGLGVREWKESLRARPQEGDPS